MKQLIDAIQETMPKEVVSYNVKQKWIEVTMADGTRWALSLDDVVKFITTRARFTQLPGE